MKKMITVFILVLIVSLMNSGCFQVRKFDLAKRADRHSFEAETIESDDEAIDYGVKKPAQNTAKKDSISVNIVMNGEFGCHLADVNDLEEYKELGRYFCNAFLVDYENAKDEIKEKADNNEVGKSGWQFGGYLFMGFEEVLKNRLEHHLGQKFNSVNVTISQTEAGNVSYNIIPAMKLHQKTMKTDYKTAIVSLNVKSNSLPLSVNGKAAHLMGNGHLAWMIPFALLTFPLGYAIGMAIFNGIETGFVEFTIIDAIDKAAMDFAEKASRL